jgi:hypothetical protein
LGSETLKYDHCSKGCRYAAMKSEGEHTTHSNKNLAHNTKKLPL